MQSNRNSDAQALLDALEKKFFETNLVDPASKLHLSHLVEVQDLIKKAKEKNSRNEITTSDFTFLLIVACKLGNIFLINMLLKAGADINAVDHLGYSPINAAIESENVKAHEVVQYLLANGAHLRNKNNIALSPLVYAASCERVQIVQTILHLMTKTPDFHYDLKIKNLAAKQAAKNEAIYVLRELVRDMRPSFVATPLSEDDEYICYSAQLVMWLIEYGQKIKNLSPSLLQYLFLNSVDDSFEEWLEEIDLLDKKNMIDDVMSLAHQPFFRFSGGMSGSELQECEEWLSEIILNPGFQETIGQCSDNVYLKDMQGKAYLLCKNRDQNNLMRMTGVQMLICYMVSSIHAVYSALLHNIDAHDDYLMSEKFYLAIKQLNVFCKSFFDCFVFYKMGNNFPLTETISNHEKFIEKFESIFQKSKLKILEKRRLEEKEKKDQKNRIKSLVRDRQKQSRMAAHEEKKLQAEQRRMEGKKETDSMEVEKENIDGQLLEEKAIPGKVKKKKKKKKNRNKQNRKNPSASACAVMPMDEEDEKRKEAEALRLREEDEKRQQAEQARLEAMKPVWNVIEKIKLLPSAYTTAFSKVVQVKKRYLVGGAAISLIQYANGVADALQDIDDYDMAGDCSGVDMIGNHFQISKRPTLFRLQQAGFKVDFEHTEGFDLHVDWPTRGFYCCAVYLDEQGNVYDLSPDKRGLADIKAKRVSLIDEARFGKGEDGPEGHLRVLYENPECILLALKLVAKGWVLNEVLHAGILQWDVKEISGKPKLAFFQKLKRVCRRELNNLAKQPFHEALINYNLGHLLNGESSPSALLQHSIMARAAHIEGAAGNCAPTRTPTPG